MNNMFSADNKITKYLFIVAIFIFCMGITCIYNVPDNDLWARLIAGGHIVENLSLIKNDFLSYTPTHTWYDHEWGSSIIFYIFLKYFGDTGLILLKGFLSALIILVCYKTVELNKTKATLSYDILYFGCMFLAVQYVLGSTIRCLLFTSLFFTLYLLILEKFRKTQNWKYLILLPIIMLFWGNMHGGCISGLGLLGIYIVGEFLNKKSIKEYIITLFASTLTLFINPYGIEYVKFLFFAAGMNRDLIYEWASPFNPALIKEYIRYKIYLVVMLTTAITYFIKNKINYKNADKTKILLIIVMTYLSVTHIRHAAFFILTVGTILYNEFYSIIHLITDKINLIKKEETKDAINLFKEVFIYLLILVIALPPLLKSNKEIRITETAYPRYAIEFIKINDLKGNLFINFDWGSYAAYKLYPNNLIVMDGRYEEVYNPDLITELRNFHLLENDWYKIIRDYKTDVIIAEKKHPVFDELLKNNEWSLVFENNLSGVFVPTSELKDNYIMPTADDNYYNKTKFNTNAIKKRV